jgi:hypothetical protein
MIVLDAEWPTDRDGIWMVGTLDTDRYLHPVHSVQAGSDVRPQLGMVRGDIPDAEARLH